MWWWGEGWKRENKLKATYRVISDHHPQVQILLMHAADLPVNDLYDHSGG